MPAADPAGAPTADDLDAAVLLIGAGGIGCGAALALGAAGCRRLTVIDDDRVELSNLPRQVLHDDARLGWPKVDSLAHGLRARFPEVQVEALPGRVNADNALALFARHAVVIDGSDNLGTKFLCNDAAVLARVPLVHAAAVGTLGHVLAVPPGGRPCYRCLFEELPAPDSDVGPSCAEAGVLAPIPGAIGALAARAALELLARPAQDGDPAPRRPLSGVLFRYDSQPMTLRPVRFAANPDCRVCGHAPDILALDPGAYFHLQECTT